MAKQDSFTTEEWTLLRLAPALVSGGMSAAEPSGIFGSVKEAAAGAGAMMESMKAGGNLELLSAMAADRSMPGMPDPKTLLGEGTREQQMQHLKGAVLDRIRQAVGIVATKATPEEAQAYRQLFVSIAERAANASKEGGFLGFGGERVSANEKAFLEEVRKAAGAA
jgi:hypothetical protein